MLKKRNLGVLKLLTGNVLSQAIAIATLPLLARSYSPEQFGGLAIITSLSSIIASVGCLRYEIAIVIPKSHRKAMDIATLAAFVAAAATLVFFFILFLFEKELEQFLSGERPYENNFKIAVLVAANCFSNIFSYLNIRNKRYGAQSVFRTISSAINAIAAVCLIPFSGGIGNGLIDAFVCAQALSLIVAVVLAKDIPCIKNLFQPNFLRVKSVAVEYRRFPMFSVLPTLLNTISWMAPAIILGWYFDSAVVGLYSVGFRLLQVPLSLIINSLSQVFLHEASQAIRTGKLSQLVEDSLIRLAIVGFPFVVLLYTFGRSICKLALGSGWEDAGIFMEYLAPWAYLWLITSPLSVIFTVLKKPHLELLTQSCIFLFRVIALFAGGIYGDRFIAVGSFSMAGVLGYSLLFMTITKCCNISNFVLLFKNYRVFMTSMGYLFCTTIVAVCFGVGVLGFTLCAALSVLYVLANKRFVC